MNRRDEILDVLVEKLSNKGFTSNFTMSEIAKSVDIGKSTIYEYFSNKDDLLKEAVMKFIRGSIASLQLDNPFETYSFEELFKCQMSKLLSAASVSRTVLETFQGEFVRNMPEKQRDELKGLMEETRKDIEQRFLSFFMKGIEEGTIPGNVTPETGVLISSLVMGAVVRYTDPNTLMDIDDYVDILYSGVLKLV